MGSRRKATPASDGPRVAFLFLGETLLIPHLYPIVEALAVATPGAAIECWVATGVHERLVATWLDAAGVAGRVRIRRAPGYLAHDHLRRGENPPLPAKLPTLIRLLPHLFGARVVVCAEQTSLWLPVALPWWRTRFIMTQHGAGSVANRVDRRRDAAYRLLLPSDVEAEALVRCGRRRDRMIVTGYVKSSFAHRTPPARLFADERPIVLYTPHWQRERSSWWSWGRAIVAMLAAQDRYNVILAPHQRLAEKDPAVRGILADVAHLPHVHTDLDSFAMVDGSYTAAADLYLGDTSSQVCEFMMRPRPCAFLNAQRIDWRRTDDHRFWECGQVIDDLPDLPQALERAHAMQSRFEALQRAFVGEVIGETGPAVADRAAAAVIAALS